MAGSKHDTDEGNPNPIPTPPPHAGEATSPPLPPPSARRPFTSLSQVDADLALARALQEQAPHHWTSSCSSMAYALLRNNGVDGSDYESSDADSYDYEEEEVEEGVGDEPDHVIEEDAGNIEGGDYDQDAFDANDPDVDDEAFTMALQDSEEQEVAVRLMALSGLNEWVSDDHDDYGNNSQDAWQEVDPDEYSYEERDLFPPKTLPLL
ncbi:unnamed protein product [Musa hybrid cultivar]